MKTPIQELIENLTEQLDKVVKEHPIEVSYDTYWRGVKIGLETTITLTESMLEKEKEQMIDFTMDYVNSDSIGCLWDGDSAPELDIDTSAEQYYERTFNTKER